MDFSFEAPSRNSSSENSVASDRLRKAIERNRAKQIKRSDKAPTPPPINDGPSLLDKIKEKRNAAIKKEAIPEKATRTGVARPFDFDFVEKAPPPVKKEPIVYADAPAVVSPKKPLIKKSAKRKVKARSKQGSRFQGPLVKAIWGGCFLLVLRLVFANGGVIDFYSAQEVLNGKEETLERIGLENQRLRDEIEKIKNSESYQRKLVRDNLGFIAQEEYLVLFRVEGEDSSI